MIYLLLNLLAIASTCQSLQSDKITAQDFARLATEFSSLPPDTSMGFAPLPGGHRVFSAMDVRRLASQNGITSVFGDSLCFEWSMRQLEPAELVDAMSQSLAGVGASGKVELDEYSKFPVPAGKVVFPLTGLNRSPQGTALWRGYVLYAGERRLNIWAKVHMPAVFDVQNGDRVSVLVENGGTQLKMNGQAVSQGVKGQLVTVRNPRSGKLFSAEVTGKGTVRVDAGEGAK